MRNQWVNAEAEGVSRFQRIRNVHIVRPGFGPVFPGMRAGISADKTHIPIYGCARPVVLFQTLFVVETFIPEQFPETSDLIGVADQSFPIIVADFVTKMSQ